MTDQKAIRTETIRCQGITVVIVSEEDARTMSARFALRCVLRDLRALARAIWRNVQSFFATFRAGHRYVTCWWTRDEYRPGKKN